MADTTTKRHPIRGAVWGLILGLGVFVFLTFVFPVIALESVTQVATQGVIVIVIVMVLSVLWGLYGPAKAPKGPSPVSTAPMPATSEERESEIDSEDSSQDS